MTNSGTPASGSGTPGNGQPTLICELHGVIKHATKRGGKARRWATIWQWTDVLSGLVAAVLAVTAGAAGLADLAGRVPAAILALSAGGLAAANQFLGSGVRYERNRKRRNAWKALEQDASLEQAKANERAGKGLDAGKGLEVVVRELLDREVAIEDMDHQPVPLVALGRQLFSTYVDPTDDWWVREVRLRAMERGEDITGSAVARWAIARAAGALAPAQAVDELLPPEQRRSGPERPSAC